MSYRQYFSHLMAHQKQHNKCIQTSECMVHLSHKVCNVFISEHNKMFLLHFFMISSCWRLILRLIWLCSVRQWQWTSEQCTLVSDTSQAGYCSCFVPGVFALTTDMYNVNVSEYIFFTTLYFDKDVHCIDRISKLDFRNKRCLNAHHFVL